MTQSAWQPMQRMTFGRRRLAKRFAARNGSGAYFARQAIRAFSETDRFHAPSTTTISTVATRRRHYKEKWGSRHFAS